MLSKSDYKIFDKLKLKEKSASAEETENQNYAFQIDKKIKNVLLNCVSSQQKSNQ